MKYSPRMHRKILAERDRTKTTPNHSILAGPHPIHRQTCSGTLRRRPKGADMGKVIVMNWVTLDGVMQGPGRPDEDTRDGFAHGGWGITYGDEATVAKMGERMGGDRAFLFGRRTYED